MIPERLSFVGGAMILAVAGALAFKKFDQKDLLVCNQVTFLCQRQGPDTAYSSHNDGWIIVPDEDVFVGRVGWPCYSAQCPQYGGTVYENE